MGIVEIEWELALGEIKETSQKYDGNSPGEVLKFKGEIKRFRGEPS